MLPRCWHGASDDAAWQCVALVLCAAHLWTTGGSEDCGWAWQIRDRAQCLDKWCTIRYSNMACRKMDELSGIFLLKPPFSSGIFHCHVWLPMITRGYCGFQHALHQQDSHSSNCAEGHQAPCQKMSNELQPTTMEKLSKPPDRVGLGRMNSLRAHGWNVNPGDGSPSSRSANGSLPDTSETKKHDTVDEYNYSL